MALRRGALVFLLLVACALPAGAESLTRDELQKSLDSTVHAWRFQLGEVPGAEAPDFDDSQWRKVEVGFRWLPHDSTCWFRTKIVLPDRIQGIAVAGAPVLLKLAMDNGAKVYVNGQLKQEFEWHEGRAVLTENATPGETFIVALHAVNGPGHGSLLDAHLTASEPMTDALGDLLDSFDIAESDAQYVPATERHHWLDRAQAALNEIDLQAFRARREREFSASVERAWSAYLQDAARLEERLDESARKLARWKELLQQGKVKGLQLAYERLDARIVESFLTYARQDGTDGNRRHQVRALKIASYLDRLCDGAIESTRAWIDQPERELRVPFAAVRGCTVRDGAFWSGDRPAFFTGVGHFGQVRDDIPILNDYGLNIVQIEIGPSRVLTAPGTVDDRSIRGDILPTLDNAARHHVAVNLLVSPHYFPKWAGNLQLADCGYGFLKHCIDAPDARRVHEEFLRTLMPLVAHHPALHSVCLSNEPQYIGKCLLARKKFHAWLRRKHGTIDAVNAIYRSAYSAFDDVPIPQDAASYPLFYDWCCFNQDNLLEFHTFLRDLIHGVREDLPVHVKVMSRAFGGPEQFELGIDHEKFNLLGSISGNDCWQMFDYKPESPYAQGWLVTAMNYTLQHSTAPANPIFNSEDHIIPDGEERHVPAAHIRTAFWTQTLHGQCAATTWVWDRGQGGDLAENILTRPNCVRALGRIGLDLNRLAREVRALQRARAEMAILYSHSSLLPSWDYVNEAEAAFEGAYFADTVCRFVTERQAVAGGLDRYKLVVVPRASHAPDNVVEAFQQYIGAGGTVMTVDDCFTRDPYGHPRARTLQQEGTGRLVTCPGPLPPREHRRRIDELLDAVGADRPVRIVGTDGQPVWGVHLRATRQERGALVTLVNFTRRPQTVDLADGKPIKRIVNLFDNTEVTLPLVLGSLDPVLLSIEWTNRRGRSGDAGNVPTLAVHHASVGQEPADTNYDESKVPKYKLPDPLVCFDGQKVSHAAMWRDVRRPEILRAFATHIANRHLRQRRVLYNFDGDSCLSTKAGSKGPVPVNVDDLKRLIQEVAYEGSRVDTVLVCINAQVMYYPTKIGTMRGTLSTPEGRAKWPASEKQRFENVNAFFDSGVDPYAIMLAEAKRRGREALLTFRMNDDHGNDFLRTQFLVDHPDWRLGAEQYRGKGAMDFARDEVRDYTFRLIEEAVYRYDCDGIELDFNRFPAFFKDGTTDQRVAKMNSLIERVRKMLDDVGCERDHRLVLGVRVPSNYGRTPPTPETAREIGCDVPAWAEQGWIDYVAVSEFLFERGDLPISQWKRTITAVPVYGGIECTRGAGQKNLTADEYRHAAATLKNAGADGTYLFNFFTSREQGENAYEPPFDVLRDLEPEK